MGRATIISGGPGGEYQITLNLHRERIDSALAILAIKLTALETLIAGLDDGPEKSAAYLQKVAGDKRVEYLNNYAPADPVVSAWCADLTEDLVGEVGTIEVPGERAGVPVLIYPGYEGGAAYDSSRDGQLQPGVAATPAALFYNLAIMPGWQKWRPTYRLGAITAKTAASCSIELDPATFSDRGSGLTPYLNINQTVTLDGVPFNYRGCDGLAFEVDDRVVVRFIDRDWQKPEVIGFESNPRACGVGIIAVKIKGKRWDVGGIEAGPAGLESWLVWDSGKSELLAVPKTAGGFWDYPISQTDYVGDFGADLQLFFGDGLAVTGAAPLFDLKAVATNIIADRHAADPPELLKFAGGVLDSYLGQAYWFPYEEECLAADPPELLEVSVSARDSTNNFGAVDTWTELGDYSRTVELVCWQADPIEFPDYWLKKSETETVAKNHALSFSAPTGGIPSELFLGYPSRNLIYHEGADLWHGEIIGHFNVTSLLPPPLAGEALALVVKNSSGAAPALFGAALSWSGTIESSHSNIQAIDIVPSPKEWSTTVAAELTARGAGSLTTIGGRYIAANYSFMESGDNYNDNPVEDRPYYSDERTFTALDNYSGARSVTFAESTLAVASVLEPLDSLQAVILVETVLSGGGSLTLSQMDAELEVLTADSHGWENPPSFVGLETDYFVRSICEVVPDAAAGDPWALADNDDLTAAVELAINDFILNNPADPDQYWKIEPALYNVKF